MEWLIAIILQEMVSRYVGQAKFTLLSARWSSKLKRLQNYTDQYALGFSAGTMETGTNDELSISE